MKCPVCNGKLDFDIKVGSATCHTCGWKKSLLSKTQRWRNISFSEIKSLPESKPQRSFEILEFLLGRNNSLGQEALSA